MVSVLATEPKVCGFKPGPGDGLLRAISFSKPFLERELKPEASFRKISRLVKELYEY
jgi:hypothetical protein